MGIPKLNISGEITFANYQGDVEVPREGLFFKQNSVGILPEDLQERSPSLGTNDPPGNFKKLTL